MQWCGRHLMIHLRGRLKSNVDTVIILLVAKPNRCSIASLKSQGGSGVVTQYSRHLNHINPSTFIHESGIMQPQTVQENTMTSSVMPVGDLRRPHTHIICSEHHPLDSAPSLSCPVSPPSSKTPCRYACFACAVSARHYPDRC